VTATLEIIDIGEISMTVRRLWNANTPPPLTYREMKALSERVLPGVHYRRRLLSRYSLVWRKP
jgi:hypothetical protein